MATATILIVDDNQPLARSLAELLARRSFRTLVAGTAAAALHLAHRLRPDLVIADVDIGSNIGAKLQGDQAEADMRVAQAKAEERRALAIANEQEMKALTQENRAKVVLAEAEVPLAMAQAFREGNLGILDYYRMKNIQADTGMRDSISKSGGDSDKK